MKKYILILFCLFIFLILLSSAVLADDKGIAFTPQVKIPGFTDTTITPSSLGNYIKAIYTYAIGVVGILSTAVIIFGGFLWATAAGNNSRVDNAKTWIGSALTGLVLALFSYTLLYMINPALVELKSIDPKQVLPLGCCQYSTTCTNDENKETCETATESSDFMNPHIIKAAGTWAGKDMRCNPDTNRCDTPCIQEDCGTCSDPGIQARCTDPFGYCACD